jgi:hypothetical protein
MIVAYRRGDGAATNYEIAWVTVALQHLRVGDDSWARIDPVHRWLQTLWSGGRSPVTWPPRRPCSPWRTVVSLRSRRDTRVFHGVFAIWFAIWSVHGWAEGTGHLLRHR